MILSTLGFSPRRKFVEVSITGSFCPLNCPMCGGRWLKGMNPTLTPAELINFAVRAKDRGAKGILISGGLDLKGRLPFTRFLSAIREIKGMGYFISVHTGLVDEEDAFHLKEAGVDMADFEMYLDDSIIRKLKGLDVGKEKYLESMDFLLEQGIYVAPHVILGVPGDELEWLTDLKSLIKEKGLDRVIALIFIPTPGTQFWGYPLPNVEDVVRAISEMAGWAKVSLGCMRPPRIKRSLDKKLLGIVDRIANPHRSLRLKIVDACCSVPDIILKDFMEEA